MQYNPSFLNYRNILSEDDNKQLFELSSRYDLSDFLKDSRNFEEVAVDFVYTSAKIEGNTYSRLDTDNLLRLGITAGGKRYSDAQMLVNLRKGFSKVMDNEPVALDFEYLCDLHQILMKDLLPVSEQGLPRTSGVQIGGIDYTPIANPVKLREEAKLLLIEADKFDNPFEKSIYLHCNLAYLQLFRDGNKRTSRMMQTAVLVQSNILPLFFDDKLIEKYISATVGYYKTGEYDNYIAFFKENYQQSIEKFTQLNQTEISAENKQEFESRISKIPSLKGSVGVQGIFVNEAVEALSKSSGDINWFNIERKVIQDSLEKGYPEFEIVDLLSRYSPVSVTAESKLSIKSDVKSMNKAIQKKTKMKVKD
ncbi:MAG: Fic family protein [Ostreibacterium sp.]